MYKIDLNCDLGESFGNWVMGNDELILPYVSSVNLACGFHAGDPSIMHKTVKNALKHNVAIGAHPSLADLVGFGRRKMDISATEVYDLVVYQIGALEAFVRIYGAKLQHVKPHGALYTMAATDADLALAIATAIKDTLGKQVFMYGLANSQLIRQAQQIGLATVSEVFADRTYTRDGLLTPRNQANALIYDENIAIQQILQMVTQNSVTTVDGEVIRLKAQTVCVHGDGSRALEMVKLINTRLADNAIGIEKPAIN